MSMAEILPIRCKTQNSQSINRPDKFEPSVELNVPGYEVPNSLQWKTKQKILEGVMKARN